MNTFQVILLVIFGAFLVIGVLIFAAAHISNQSSTPTIVMWGTISQTDIRSLLDAIDQNQRGLLKITYVYKDPATFDKDFTEALAIGKGPDLAIISDDEIMLERDKLNPIPFQTLSDRAVKDTFIQEADLFRTSKGYLALPFIVDPLVMYWNRDIFQSAGISKPPQSWSDFAPLVSTINITDSSLNIQRSAIAFGEYSNVTNAKNILSTLIIQAGNPITQIGNDQNPDAVSVVLDQKFNGAVEPAVAALDFYTQFANSSGAVYSWNKSLPSSQDSFLAGNLATYFGFASELGNLQKKNPNLNLDVAPIPQQQNTTAKLTYAHLYGIALVHGSPNTVEAYRSMSVLTGAMALGLLTNINNLPPTRRDLLASSTPSNAPMEVFRQPALQGAAWLDPNPQLSDKVFSDMVESVKSGAKKTSEAVGDATAELQALIQ